MTTLRKTYATELAARRAAGALRATGVPERDNRLGTGRQLFAIATVGICGPAPPKCAAPIPDHPSAPGRPSDTR